MIMLQLLPLILYQKFEQFNNIKEYLKIENLKKLSRD